MGGETGRRAPGRRSGASSPLGRAPPARPQPARWHHFSTPGGPGRAGLGGAGGRSPCPHFSCSLPPPGRPGGRANGRREEGAGSGALGTALPRRPGRGAHAKFAPREWGSLGLAARSRERVGRQPLGTAAHGRTEGRTRSSCSVRVGAAASRRCGMAAAPPASLAHRTTGSTCLHPLSRRLGIPLDQVSAAGRALPARAAWGYWGDTSPSVPAPRADSPAAHWTGGQFLELVFNCKCEKRSYTLHDSFDITFFFSVF